MSYILEIYSKSNALLKNFLDSIVNDGYIICGAQNKNSSVIKLDKSNGSIIWEKSFDNGGSDAFEHLALRSNGFMAVGYKNAEDGQNTFYTQGEGYITFLNNQE